MDLLIATAYAQGGQQAPQDPGLMGLLPLILIFVIFYFLLMRPQIKRAKEHKKMVDSLSKNDEVVTSGGMLGRITRLDEQFVTVEIAEGVRVKVQRNAISAVLPKGTLKDKGSDSRAESDSPAQDRPAESPSSKEQASS